MEAGLDELPRIGWCPYARWKDVHPWTMWKLVTTEFGPTSVAPGVQGLRRHPDASRAGAEAAVTWAQRQTFA
jgi:hypothetical protein